MDTYSCVRDPSIYPAALIRSWSLYSRVEPVTTRSMSHLAKEKITIGYAFSNARVAAYVPCAVLRFVEESGGCSVLLIHHSFHQSDTIAVVACVQKDVVLLLRYCKFAEARRCKLTRTARYRRSRGWRMQPNTRLVARLTAAVESS